MGNPSRVAWYGKHPAWDDFMTGAFHPPSAAPLRDWVDHGRAFLEKGDQKKEERGECFFALSKDAGDQIYCGVIGPSRDGADRIFPLAVYVPLVRRRYRRAYPLLPAYAAPAWDDMRSVYRKCLAARQREDVDRVLTDLATAIPPPSWGAWRRFRKDVGKVSATDFLGTLSPDGGAPSELLARMAEALAPFRDGRLGPPPLAFDLPVSSVLKTAAYQAAFWLRVCESGLGSLVRQPSFFLHPDEKGMRLSIFLRDPEPADYGLMLVGIGDTGRMYRLDAEGQPLPEGAARQAIETAFGEARSVADLFACRWNESLRGAR